MRELSIEYGLRVANVFHAGDGNLHPTILCDKRDKEEFARVEAAVDEIFDVALKLGGTLSGEHGIGFAKRPYLAKSLSPAEQMLMQGIKQLFDPKNILNPGKVIGA